MMYAELIGNYKKQGIKSPCDNKIAYVEYGHRTRGHKGWVQGRFMLTISVDEIQSAAPKILEKKLAKWLGDMLNGN